MKTTQSHDNDLAFLDAVLRGKREQYDPQLSEDEYFEFFTIDTLLEEFDLNYDDVSDGVVDGGDDGGIDGLFTFVNGCLAYEDTDLKQFRKNVEIEILIIQSKKKATFEELAIDKVRNSIADLFSFSKERKVLQKVYNSSLIDKALIARHVLRELAVTAPKILFKVVFVTRGLTTAIHPKVAEKSSCLENEVRQLIHSANAVVSFVGARELLDVCNKARVEPLQLTFSEGPVSSAGGPRVTASYVGLVRLVDFFKFVTDPSNQLIRTLFESNVRDYQGEVEVNKDISLSLQALPDIDFWWLNNGITIIASQGSLMNKTISLDDAQIVNGLQTTSRIFEHLRETPHTNDPRSVLIRVIITKDAEVRDKIIKATNFQTVVSPVSLRATDPLQRKIEDYFATKGFCYERRKNSGRIQGVATTKVISVQMLAQAVGSVLLQRPHYARSKPTSLLKSDITYKEIFDDTHPPSMYIVCATLSKQVDHWIKSDERFLRKMKMNLKHHLAMWCAVHAVSSVDYGPNEICGLDVTIMNDEYIGTRFDEVQRIALLSQGFDIDEQVYLTDVFIQMLDVNSVSKSDQYTQMLLSSYSETH